MEDIAILTDATVVSTDKGMKLEEAGMEVLGTCGKVIATKDETTIIKGAGDKKDEYDLDKFRRLKADAAYGIGPRGARKARCCPPRQSCCNQGRWCF